MKIVIRGQDKKELKKIELPVQFHEPVRRDVISRAFLAERSRMRQRYGAKDDAGKRASAKLSRRRRDFKGSYGIGISRVPRKILSGKGSRWNWVGAFAPGMVGGRRSHPPKSSKIIIQKINTQERNKALRSALHGTVLSDVVKQRGHIIPAEYPFVIDNSFEQLVKAKDVRNVLRQLGFDDDLQRGAMRHVRAGKGKRRGRKYKGKKSLLVVTGEICALSRAVKNLPGVDVSVVSDLNINLLAPGAVPGRATLYTQHALQKMQEDKLFI